MRRELRCDAALLCGATLVGRIFSLSLFLLLSLSHPLPSSREGDGSGGLSCTADELWWCWRRSVHRTVVACAGGAVETGEWALESLPQA